MVQGDRRNSPDASLAGTLPEHSQKCNDILNVVLHIQTRGKPKIDALRIDMGHLHEDFKKLKERVDATENTVSDMHPSVA
ncbi:hypothetical protein NDU88_001359 [Pleurodeles waltl]|uniref:Uncharacterized protein n=1 Tax=Pleurodeles waltl TaxID=8319 RepID=A0AAV7VW65_PLEWA|nr:hypothetical protein NDU88_001359 [Pleurodeles waltl]